MATVTALRKPKTKITVGGLIDQMSTIREERRALTKAEKAKGAELAGLETQLLELMAAEGQTKATGRLATASVKTSTFINKDNWDLFIAYVIKTKQGHLVERSPSKLACLEVFALKGMVPGLSTYNKDVIGLRNVGATSDND